MEGLHQYFPKERVYKGMTDKEKAIVMAHTGICMLTGDKFQIFHKYVEDIMGRPIMTHEIGLLADTIKEKTKADFIALCADERSSENPNKWVLDKIRAEIDKIYERENSTFDCLNALDELKELIDKLKAETEHTGK